VQGPQGIQGPQGVGNPLTARWTYNGAGVTPGSGNFTWATNPTVGNPTNLRIHATDADGVDRTKFFNSGIFMMDEVVIGWSTGDYSVHQIQSAILLSSGFYSFQVSMPVAIAPALGTPASITLLPTGLWSTSWGLVVPPAMITANTTPTAGQYNVPGLSITYTVIAGRRYRITAFVRNIVTSASASVDWGVGKANVLIGYVLIGTPAMAAGNYGAGSGIAFDAPTVTAAATYTGRISASAGNTNLVATAAAPAWLTLEDMGPQ
jgi:hypothetical protein